MLKNDAARRQEHETIRNHVGFYDFTHQLVEVKGPDALTFLDRIYVNKIAATKPGRAQYTTMLNEDGKIIDDVIVFRLTEDTFWVSTLYVKELLDWLEKHKGSLDVSVEEITHNVSMFAVQGPKSRDLLNKILQDNIDDLKYFRIRDNKLDGLDVKVARAGFTGELGFEIYIQPDKTDQLRSKLLKAGEEFGIKEMTTDVILKSLPVEKGYVLMSDVGGLTPMEAMLDLSIDWDSDFIGKDALLKEKEQGSPMRLRGFTLTGDEADVAIEEGAPVTYNGEEVGKVTSFTYGYTVEKYIGYVLIDTEKVPENEPITLTSGGKDYTATSHDRIFYDEEHSRIRA
ncbi:aminomethyltransferase family protein [Atopococcus tabaci]|uniref:aminomethyltransferase family protein n=1 Tax=Atopococcus tabaci TaxID=269774 RepID=UPI00041BE723|nr:aminomethyltransferase family protein [Atopococcus tabaci]